jgi:hypothetical protein
MTKKTVTQLTLSIIFLLLSACSSDQGDQGQATQGSNQMPATANSMGEMNMETSMNEMPEMSGMTGVPHAMTMPETDELGQSRSTDNALFQVRIEPAIDPLPLNRMHGWVLSLVDAAGAPVDGAVILVEGGMPAHNHGMPTSPQVTDNLGEGRYQIEGVQFQMPGHWVIRFNISADGLSDSVTYNLMLQP